ncbi:MAG: ribosome biogenesis GTP-binding protein YihA/YsxC [bacterium]|jgi:GTP-binding protein
MQIGRAEFLISSAKVEQCPKPDRPEYAFIGRSNVGKSSLINMLAGRKKLAKVSGSPGKTITINHFVMDETWFLVDLPGYGFAKRSKAERARWEKMIRNYILKRTNLLSVFLLIDLRHPPQANDLEFMEWLAMSQIPFTILFTKSDKLKAGERQASLVTYRRKLEENWEELPRMIITSAREGTGREEVLSFINQTNKIFRPIA